MIMNTMSSQTTHRKKITELQIQQGITERQTNKEGVPIYTVTSLDVIFVNLGLHIPLSKKQKNVPVFTSILGSLATMLT